MAPRIYHLHPLVAGALSNWPSHFARCREMGFDTVCVAPPFVPGASGDIFVTADFEALHPALGWSGSADEGIALVARQATDHGLRLWLDLAIDRVASDAAIRRQQESWFGPGGCGGLPSPHRAPHRLDVAYARLNQTNVADALGEWWLDRLGRLVQAGIGGFRCLEPDNPPAAAWRHIVQSFKQCRFMAWTPGVNRADLSRLADVGFDFVCCSLAWWDGRAHWFFDEYESLHRVAPVIASPEPSFFDRCAPGRHRFMLRLAAAVADGVFVPMGFEYATRRGFDAALAGPDDFVQAREDAAEDLSAEITANNALIERIAGSGDWRDLHPLNGPHDPAIELLRTDAAKTCAMLVLANPDVTREVAVEQTLSPLPPSAGAAFVLTEPCDCAVLDAGEVRALRYTTQPPVVHPSEKLLDRQELAGARIAIETVRPFVPDGPFAVKRLVGERVAVTADIICDGHDMLAANLLWKSADETTWHRVPMQLVENDRWEAAFAPDRVGRYTFTVEAWWDAWATFRHDLHAKHEAGQVVTLEIEEGRRSVQTALARAPKPARTALQNITAQLTSLNAEQQVALLLAEDTASAMHAVDDQPFVTRHEPAITLDADRPQAAFASWYEMFPRSATDVESRHGTFADVIRRLPDIRDMGFDVLYFPPIHPIGTTNRKGRNNALRAEPDDVGSPYAIGGQDGGHDAIHPSLGTLSDFRALIAAAKQHDLEIALDFAIQCSPDHPWLREHPDWFRWRPDGSLRYAENPPKKYEDIVNPDFFADAAVPSLWQALRDVVRFWAEQGVRIFRVDNPHTKPLPFWEWMINDIRGRYPDTIFLAEAFTRPKMMYRLAKVGFTQSYTYFTWRNTKQEITEYLTELNELPVREFFRPNFFVNTPDINPPFLQTSGRPGFLIRAALACTLSGLWGMYSGFEICEAAPLPGREEYLDSEKYQIRVRDYAALGNIAGEITALNRLRRKHSALQSHLGITFYPAFNDQVLLYGKRTPGGRDMILVAVSLDPQNVQEAMIEIPLWEWDLPDDASLTAIDLMRGHQFTWTGKQQSIRLDPNDLPFAIWQVAPPGLP